MANVINIKKGLDINLNGEAVKEKADALKASVYSLTPTDFHGRVYKVAVRAGDKVKAGSPLLNDKKHTEINFVSPVSGTVKEIVRGAKRKLLNVLIEADENIEYESFDVKDPKTLSGDEVKSLLCKSGLWPFIKQRPYDVIADPSKTARDIFITGFDSMPLAPDYSFIADGQGKDFQTGIDALTRLTEGKVFLSLPYGCDSDVFNNAKGVEVNYFKGKNPAGNVSVQINHIAPVNRGEDVWVLKALDVLFIGRFFNKGIVDFKKTVAATGPQVNSPKYINTIIGAPVSSVIAGNIKEGHNRIVNGNPLVGSVTDAGGYVGFYDYQVTVLREGDDIDEIFGWVLPRFNKFSMSHTYFSFLQKNKKYSPDTRVLGSERALIMSGEYDKVFPMDILPEQLVRACITEDYEKMENLGIYEVAPEDFALCEFVCTSKVEVQKVVREALDSLQKENGD